MIKAGDIIKAKVIAIGIGNISVLGCKALKLKEPILINDKLIKGKEYKIIIKQVTGNFILADLYERT